MESPKTGGDLFLIFMLHVNGLVEMKMFKELRASKITNLSKSRLKLWS